MATKKLKWECFEDEIFEKVKNLVNSYSLSINPKFTKIYRKKSYYSELRKSEIEFEIALECFDKGATEPSVIWLWECKDKSKSERMVEAGDVEQLHSKIMQLGMSRVRGSMITTHGYQTGAEQLAISVGISLFVVSKEWIRITKFSQEAQNECRKVMTIPFMIRFTGQRCTDLPEDALIQVPFRDLGLI